MRRWPALTLAVAAATAASVAALAPAQAVARTQAVARSQAAAVPGWRIWQVAGAHSGVGAYTGITAVSRNDAWVVGNAARLVVKHWTGRSWDQVSLGAASSAWPGGSEIAAGSATNVLVADSGVASSDLVRLAGAKWSVSHLRGAYLGNVATFGGADAWAFGQASHSEDGYAAHYDGRSWAKTSVPVVASLPGMISAVSASDIWAVGVTAAHPYGNEVETAYYDGKSWKAVPITNLHLPSSDSLYFPVILALSAKNVWVYSWLQGFQPHAGLVPLPEAVLTHWNGKAWSRVTVPYTTIEAGYIAADGRGGVWLSADGGKGVPYLYHYNGGRWTRTTVPTEPGYSAWVFALDVIPGTTGVWAAGELLSKADNQHTRAVIWRYGA